MTPRDDDARPWWSVGNHAADEDVPPPPAEAAAGHQQPAAPPMPPGWQITFTPPAPPADPHAAREAERLARARRWLAYHGVAAGIGWYSGVGRLAQQFLEDMGRGGAMAGLVMAFITYTAGESALQHITGNRIFPQRLQPAARLITRIPFATLAVALALNTPNALGAS